MRRQERRLTMGQKKSITKELRGGIKIITHCKNTANLYNLCGILILKKPQNKLLISEKFIFPHI